MADHPSNSRRQIIKGRILCAVLAALLILDGSMKVIHPLFIVQANVDLGYSPSLVPGIGITLLACTLLYLIPRTSFLGMILLTAFLGGATASHLRAGDGLFPVIFPIIIAVLLWISLALRNSRLRALIAAPA